MGNEQGARRKAFQYTEEEKDALQKNAIVRLPCHPNPFAGFGKSKYRLGTPPKAGAGEGKESFLIDIEREKEKRATEDGTSSEQTNEVKNETAKIEAEKKDEEKEKEPEKEPSRWEVFVEILSRNITNLQEFVKGSIKFVVYF